MTADGPAVADSRPGLEPGGVVPAEGPGVVEEGPAESREAVAAEAVADDPEERVSVTISARFVDEHGLPLAGVELAASSIAGCPVAVSDGTGRAELVLPWEDLRGFFPQPCSFVMGGPGLVTRADRQWFGGPEDRFLGEVPMQPGGAVRGRVVDPDGRGVADAVVGVIFPVLAESAEREELRVFGGQPGASASTRTESAGSFVLDGLPATPFSITARAAGTFHAVSEPVSIRAGETLDVGELVLEPAPEDQQIAGVVRTESGGPVRGAGIRLLDEGRAYIKGRATSDELGAFRFTVAPGVLYALQVLDYSAHGWPDVNLDAIEPGTTDLVVVFQDTTPLLVRVTGPDGRPVRRFRATLTTTDHHFVPGGRAVSADGRPVELRAPQAPYLVAADAPGYASERKGPIDPSEPIEELVFVLRPGVGIAGHVTAGGRPVAGAVVEAHTALEEGRKGVTAAGFQVLVQPRSWLVDETGPEGEYFLVSPVPARFQVHVKAPGFARAASGPIDFDPEQGNRELDFELVRGGAVEGRVLVTSEGHVSGRTIALSRGDGHFESTVTGVDGSFRFEELTPGPWQIRACEPAELERARSGGLRRASAGEPIPWDLEVRAGETTRYDLDLTGHVCRLEGRFLVDGKTPVAWTWGVPTRRPGLYNQRFDSEGRFAFEVDEPGTWNVQLIAPRTPGAFSGMKLELELFAGLNSWEGAVDTGTLELTGVDAPALADVDPGGGQIEAACMLLSEQAHGLSWFASVIAVEEGRIRLPSVPGGHILLFDGEYGRLVGGPEPAPDLEFDLAPGETKTIALE